MSKIQIIIGSTRPNRVGPTVAKWVYKFARHENPDIEFELVDLKDYNLPLLDEPKLPADGNYEKDHTKKWAAKIAEANGYILVTPEYNHGYAASVKNALDLLYAEWNDKPIAFVGYGVMGGVRAVEQLRQVVSQLRMHAISTALLVSKPSNFIESDVFEPAETHKNILKKELTDLISLVNLLN